VANIFPRRIIDSVNGQVGQVKLKILNDVKYQEGTSYVMEFLDQDGELLDSISLGINNIQGLQTELDKIVTDAGNDFIPNTALNNYVKLSEQELASIRNTIEEYNSRVLASGGGVEQQINVKDVIGNDKNAGIIIRNINVQNGVVKDIELDFLEIEDVQGLPAALDNKEDVLGNPETNDEALVSTTDGERAWRKIVEDKYHVYEQVSATNSWTINHGLDKHPSVHLEDDEGNEVNAKVNHINNNQVTITFNNPFSGKAYFN
jgi:hypothetical protein